MLLVALDHMLGAVSALSIRALAKWHFSPGSCESKRFVLLLALLDIGVDLYGIGETRIEVIRSHANH